MQIAKIENGQVVEINHYRTLFPNVSFGANGPNDSFLASNNCKRVKTSETIDRATQKIVSTTAYVSGDWVKTYNVVSLTQDEIDAKTAAEAARKEKAVRDRRNALLAETDWFILKTLEAGNTVSTEWSTYRQALRDITSHANFPDLVENVFDDDGNKTSGDWPVKPE